MRFCASWAIRAKRIGRRIPNKFLRTSRHRLDVLQIALIFEGGSFTERSGGKGTATTERESSRARLLVALGSNRLRVKRKSYLRPRPQAGGGRAGRITLPIGTQLPYRLEHKTRGW